jgi:predicted transcriptional regulator
MQKKNEEETQRAQLGMVLLFIEQEGIIPPGEVVRMMQPEVPLQEIVNLINKHANQIKQGLQQMQTQWNNML